MSYRDRINPKANGRYDWQRAKVTAVQLPAGTPSATDVGYTKTADHTDKITKKRNATALPAEPTASTTIDELLQYQINDDGTYDYTQIERNYSSSALVDLTDSTRLTIASKSVTQKREPVIKTRSWIYSGAYYLKWWILPSTRTVLNVVTRKYYAVPTTAAPPSTPNGGDPGYQADVEGVAPTYQLAGVTKPVPGHSHLYAVDQTTISMGAWVYGSIITNQSPAAS